VVVALAVGMLAACGGDDDDGAASDEFCDLARQADSAGDAMGAAVETGDPDEIERVFQESMDDLRAAADAAPDAIREIADEVTETAQDLRDRFEELDWDVTAFVQDGRVQEIAAQSEDSNTQLDEFLERECDIPPDTETAETDPPGTGAAPTDSAAGGAIAGALAAAFESLGLTSEQAQCLADRLIDELGTEGLAGLDPSTLDLGSPEGQVFVDALGECDIDPTVLAGN
jgi:hypothetical protein